MKRILINELEQHVGERVLLKGWVATVRPVSKKMSFVILRERTGRTQIISKLPIKLNEESVIEVIGTVKRENQSRYNSIEVVAESINIISEGQSALPVTIYKTQEIPMTTMLKYNGLTLREEKRAAIFKVEAEIINGFREYMRSQEFTEIHSTKIVNEGLEGGGNMFEVNYFGSPVFLSQSPQFFKQMMVGVYERVFEVGKVYRAEQSQSNRHLAEYIGLEIEMGFISGVEEVMTMEESMIQYVMNQVSENCKEELELFGVTVPSVNIPRLTFQECLELIGVKEANGFSNEMEVQLGEAVMEKYGSEFVFVNKYPLSKRPFYTMPSEEEGCSESFELLYKGMEITTGGQRIHQYEELVSALEEKGLEPEAYEQYLMAFKYGMPPHGGCGIGVERIVKQLLNLNSVEEASLVPRSKGRFV